MDASIKVNGSVFSRIRCSLGVAVLDCWCPRSLFSRAGVPPPRRKVSQSPVISSHTARETVSSHRQPATSDSDSFHQRETRLVRVPVPVLAHPRSLLLLVPRRCPPSVLTLNLPDTRQYKLFLSISSLTPCCASQKFIPFSPHIPAISLSITPPPSPSHYFHISNIPSPA